VVFGDDDPSMSWMNVVDEWMDELTEAWVVGSARCGQVVGEI
jgi:hypothetical protein